MGKSYENYMCKKDFHPSSNDNIKRVWMRQQKLEYEKKKQEEMMDLYRKEQDMHETRVLMGDSKAKVGLSFMYDAPPGLEKKNPEEAKDYKFEWQRNAPREAWMKNDKSTLQDQPFGIAVRNVKCIKCGQWGHINTDRECPLFNKTSTFTPAANVKSHSGYTDEGVASSLQIKSRLFDPVGGKSKTNNKNHQLIEENEQDSEVSFLQGLTKKEKKKLLRRLQRIDGEKSGKVTKKKNKKSKKKKKRQVSSSSSDSSDEEDHKKRSKKNRRKKEESNSSEDERKTAKSKKKKKDKRREKYSSEDDQRNDRFTNGAHSSKSYYGDNKRHR